MKSTIEAAPVVTENIKFPVLMETKSGNIVLFASRTQGVCVGSRRGDALLGEAGLSWNFDTSKPFRGKVILDGGE